MLFVSFLFCLLFLKTSGSGRLGGNLDDTHEGPLKTEEWKDSI